MIVQARVFGVALAFLSLLGAAFSSVDAETPAAQQQRAPLVNQPANPGPPATMRASKPVLTERCEDLGRKFKALDKRNFAYSSVVLADLDAAKGEELCPTNPQRGIELIEAAYRELGLQPR